MAAEPLADPVSVKLEPAADPADGTNTSGETANPRPRNSNSKMSAADHPNVSKTSRRLRAEEKASVRLSGAERRELQEQEAELERNLRRRRRRSRSLSESCRRLGLLAFEQIPDWARDNPFIRTNYRINMGWQRSAKSLCMLHNETLNVWTHLMGFAIVLLILLVTHATFSRHGLDRMDLEVAPRELGLSCFRFPAPLRLEQSFLSTFEQDMKNELPPEIGIGNDFGDLEAEELLLDAPTLHQLHAYHGCCCRNTFEDEEEMEEPSNNQDSSSSSEASGDDDVSSSSDASSSTSDDDDESNTSELNQKKNNYANAHQKKKKKKLESEESCENPASKLRELFSVFQKKNACALSFDCSAPKTRCPRLRSLLLHQLTSSSSSGSFSSSSSSSSSEDDESESDDGETSSSSSSNSDKRKKKQNNSEELNFNWPALESLARSLRQKVARTYDAGEEAYARSLRLFEAYALGLEEAASAQMEGAQQGLDGVKALIAQGQVNFHALAKRVLRSGKAPEQAHEAADALVEGFAHFFWAHSRGNRTLLDQLALDAPLHFPQLVAPEGGGGVVHYLSLWPVAVFMGTALACLAFSTLFHLFCAVSESIAQRMQTLDYAGIALLISGSSVPVIHYGFYCDPSMDLAYLGLTLFMGALGFMIVVLPAFQGKEFRHIKTLVFVLMGFAAAAPIPHLGLRYGMEVWQIVEDLLIMGALYLFGAMLYLSRVPERFSPGKFDLLCHSHQLWHVLVFLAVIWHFQGSLRFYEWRMLKPCHTDAFAG